MPASYDDAADAAAAVDNIADRIKVLLLKDIMTGAHISLTQTAVSDLINRECAKLAFVDDAMKRSLGALAQKLYASLKQNLNWLQMKLDREVKKTVESIRISLSGEIEVGAEERFRNVANSLRQAFPLIKDYSEKVQTQMLLFRLEPPVERKGAKQMSLRALSEMKVRHDANMKDLRDLREQGVEYAWISSHAGCSERCAPYQGKLVVLTGKSSGTLNGIPYIPLGEAMAGKEGDGNGCISGYNCRHYLIPYKAGSRKPSLYSESEISEEREIDRKQRYYENMIRKLKEEKSVIFDPDKKKRLDRRLKNYNAKYNRFCIDNKRPIERERTKLYTKVNLELERIVSDVDPSTAALESIFRRLLDEKSLQQTVRTRLESMLDELKNELKTAMTRTRR